MEVIGWTPVGRTRTFFSEYACVTDSVKNHHHQHLTAVEQMSKNQKQKTTHTFYYACTRIHLKKGC